MRKALLVATLAFAACGGEESGPATLEPEPGPVEVADDRGAARSGDETAERAEGPVQEDDPQPPLPAPEEGRVHVFVVPEGGRLTAQPDSPIRYGGSRFESEESPRLAALLSSRMEELRRSTLAIDERDWGTRSTLGSVPLASAHLVSVVWSVYAYDSRDISETKPYAYHFRIEEDVVEPMDVADAFVPGTDLSALVRESCQRERETDELVSCELFDRNFALALGENQLLVYSESPTEDQLEIDYRDIAEHLVAEGPLARSFDRVGLTTRTVEVTTPLPRESRIREVERWAVMPMGTLAELASAWSTLSAESRAATEIVGGYLVGRDEGAARAAARALGTEASHVRIRTFEGIPPVSLRLVRTHREIDLLSDPREVGVPTAHLARGTLVVATEPLESASEEVYVVARPGTEGYIEGRRLTADRVCAPELGPFLRGLPAAARSSARTGTLRVALTGGSSARATYVTEHDGVTHVEVRRIDDDCTIGRSLTRFSRPGTFSQVSFTHTTRQGGESLVVTVTGGEGASVSAHRLGSAEPVWSRPLEAGARVETSVREEDLWFPIVVHPGSGPPLQVGWGDSGPTLPEQER